ncbi:MAG: TetR/AcrR family transcriptional regulator [Bacteroidales bacterium]|nr:TetR/AcrR family transcriptional regulator [Candidatus Cacconaster merdequi]
MPRSAFFSKETIAAAGLEVIRRQGVEALTARALSKQLGCSLSPIFTVFKDMDEIHIAVRQAAAALFDDYVKDVIDYQPAFKEYGMSLIRFAKQEQNVFQLFLERGNRLLDNAPGIALKCLDEIKESYQLTDNQVRILYRQLWAFTCGIAVLATQSPEDYPEELISEMISTQFLSTLSFLKSGRPVVNVTPHLKVEGENTLIDL